MHMIQMLVCNSVLVIYLKRANTILEIYSIGTVLFVIYPSILKTAN